MIEDVLKGKNIILGITGGIAAYKTPLLVRELIERGAEVKVVMTPSAVEFITPLTLSSLSRHEVIVNIFPADQKQGTGMTTWHIDYSVWADLIIIAPATVNTIAKIAHGFADNALTTLICAKRSPVIIAPAADVDMYNNPVNLENLNKLKSLGFYMVDAEVGFLASGLRGKGRMADINKIIDFAELIAAGFTTDYPGKKVLISAGPTYEDIDPVRFIGNRSTGKMGFALAKAAFLRGAEVTLITGPSDEKCYPEIKLVKVRSALQMKNAVNSEIGSNDIFISSAAVADYTPVNFIGKKIKRNSGPINLELNPTEDILSSVPRD